MNYQEYAYEYEMEPEPGQDSRRLIRIVVGLAAAALVGCACILCILVVFWAGFSVGSRTNPEPTPTIGQLPEPVVVFPPEARVGEPVTFDGSQSRPGSSPIARYEWDFGDGTVGSGAVVTHIYNAPGTYQVTLTVTGQDGLGNTGGLVPIVIIAGVEPTPTIGQLPEPVINFPPEARVGEEVTFDGSQSRPGSTPIASYEWGFGDGTGGSGAVVTHVYNAPGTYQVTLTVTGQDGFGNTGGPVEIVIIAAVEPAPTTGQLPEPVINFPPEAKVGEPVTFDGTQSRPGSSPIASYEWDFGDGTGGNGAIVFHGYNAPGTYQVTLTVTGQDGFGNTGGPVPILIVE